MGASSSTRQQDSADKVTVLLAVYNGEAYLQSFLDSLEKQTYPHWQLVWYDDGSVDGSCLLLKQFAKRFPAGQIMQARPKREIHMGVAKAFFFLLKHALPDSFISFADQDDIWFQDKLARAIQILKRDAGDQPALYCSRQELIGADRQSLGKSPLVTHVPVFPGALTQNIATGCTVVLNPSAADMLKNTHQVPMPEGLLHDWWAYLIVSAKGGKVIYDPQPTLFYRQHGGNVVGSQASVIKRGMRAYKRGSTLFMTLMKGSLSALKTAHPHVHFSGNTLTLIESLSTAIEQPSFRKRWRILRQYPQLRRQNLLETLVFYIWFLFG